MQASNIKLFAVLGNPISHSLSPLIHNHASKLIESKFHYTRIAMPLNIDSKGLRDVLLQSDLSGVNITIPFKEIAYNAVDEVIGIANDIKAVNTIVKKQNRLLGYNTDAEGFFYCIDSILNKSKNSQVLILGAGGSAKSIATILSKNNINFCVANRSKERLIYFKDMAKTLCFDEIILDFAKYNIIVNATSSGLNDTLPLPHNVLQNLFSNSQLAFDLMYKKDALTAFCKVANECGTAFMDGKNMLIYQAALAFKYFHDSNICLDKIVQTMNEALFLA